MPFENFSIIESTLREGEQFSSATFSTAQKLEIATLLDEFGVEMIEMTSPVASPQSEADIRAVVAAGLKARILTHIRCKKEDAQVAVDTGVHGVDVVIGFQELIDFPVGEIHPGIRVAAMWASEAEREETIGGIRNAIGGLVGWIPTGEPDDTNPDLLDKVL